MLPDKKNEMRVSKTRFRSQDRSKETRSVCSPRLKSFPAEKIKKLNNPSEFLPEPIGALLVQQNPRETGTFFMGPTIGGNNDRGDAKATQLSPIHQQPKPCVQNAFSMSQQQVAAGYQQINRANLQSESSPIQRIASPEGQTHRPFVPNSYQAAAAIRERSPRNSPTAIDQPIITQASPIRVRDATLQMQQSFGDSHAIVDRNETLNTECVNQPVGGRNAANHRQVVQQQRQAQTAIVRDANTPDDRSVNNCQVVHLQSVHRTSPQDLFRQMPQQTCQQSQHNTYHQQVSQQTSDYTQPMSNQPQQMHNLAMQNCDCCNKRFSFAQFPGQGMTSPQDMTMSQMRLMQHNLPVHQQNLGYSVNPQPCQSSWSQNDRWLQATSHSQQHLHQQHSPQYYRQTQSSNFNRQSSGSHSQSVPLRNQTSHKSIDQQPNAHSQQCGERKTPQFTADMIRDQELLVATMKQQGVPDEVMRRQFEALLNEQRRHLAYVAQFQQQEETLVVAKETCRSPRRGVERDEKPEWMVHITPPRLSYNELERMRTQQRDRNAQCPMNEQPLEEAGGTMPARQPNCQRRKEETIDQSIPPQQTYFQMDPHQLWQQRTVNWSYRNDHQTPYGHHAGCYARSHRQNMPNNMHYQSNQALNKYNRHQSFCQYPYNVPYHAHPERQNVCPKEHDASSPNSIDDRRVAIDSARFHEQNRRKSVESSSLLKLRMYKEVIRPQKRNNGLQDPEIIQKTLKALKDPTSRKGLEYLVNLSKRKPMIKLNGIQEPGEVPEETQSQPLAQITPQIQKEVSANGLENSRNPDNPPPRFLRPKRAEELPMTEYPRQRQNPRTCYSVQAERENGTTMAASHATAASYTHHAESIPYEQQRNVLLAQERHSNDAAMAFQFGGAPRYHQMHRERYYPNGQSFHSGGQGDVATTQHPDAPGASRIDRAGGDTSENSSAERTTKCIAGGAQTMQGINAHGQSHEATRIIGCAGYPVGKPDYARNDSLVVSPDKLIASRHLQPPMIF